MAEAALVNKIIPFSSVDGPGNRSAIFLQGCNFDCLYCHNPETIHLCRGCGQCVAACPAGALELAGNIPCANAAEHGPTGANFFSKIPVIFNAEKCISCDTCIRVCPHGSSPRIRPMTAEDVMAVVRKQLPYIRGITVSGGECTLQRDFLLELFTLARGEGLHCLLDSNGTLDFAKDPALTDAMDGVMLDIKAFFQKDHKKVTGADNTLVLQNAVFLASIGKLPEIRTVIVPGLFDYEETVTQITHLLAKYLDIAPIRYKLIKYRPFGVRKQYAALLSAPSDQILEQLKNQALACGFRAIIA